MEDVLKSASFEHRFWLEIMGDHARFIRDSFYLHEKEYTNNADELVRAFEQLLMKAEQLSTKNIIAFTKEAETAVEALKKFKLSVMKEMLHGNVRVYLSTTSVNHMVSELEEYERIMNFLKEGKASPPFHELHHHLTWLIGLAGHARDFQNELDPVEIQLKNASQHFSEQLGRFYLRAVELTGYIRASTSTFPALKRFNRHVQEELKSFAAFLRELEAMERSHEVLKTSSIQKTNHIQQETNYYFLKITESEK